MLFSLMVFDVIGFVAVSEKLMEGFLEPFIDNAVFFLTV